MSTTALRLGIEIVIALKALFTVYALISVGLATKKYKRLTDMQKYHFWFVAPLSIVALLWVVSIAFLITYPQIAPMMPETGWMFIFFASPIPALAGGASLGMYTNGAKKVVQQVSQSS